MNTGSEIIDPGSQILLLDLVSWILYPSPGSLKSADLISLQVPEQLIRPPRPRLPPLTPQEEGARPSRGCHPQELLHGQVSLSFLCPGFCTNTFTEFSLSLTGFCTKTFTFFSLSLSCPGFVSTKT